jgi:hypothetical protein
VVSAELFPEGSLMPRDISSGRISKGSEMCLRDALAVPNPAT